MNFKPIIQFDHDLLVLINNWHSPFFDQVMWVISSKWTWIPLYILMVGYLIYLYHNDHSTIYLRRKNKTRELHLKPWVKITILLLAIVICFGLADYISSGIIKHAVCRLRPTRNPNVAPLLHLVNNYRGGMYGFVSSHAANTFSVALLYSLIVKKKSVTWTLVIWVALNCYSRMYLGVHYPGDIIGGLLVGGVIATLIYALLFKVQGSKLKVEH